MIFNQGGSHSAALPRSFSFLRNKSLQKKNQISITLGTDFTIRVQNTENTLPLIVENEIESVTIQNDTTINFDVTSVPTALVNIDSTHQIIQGYGAASPWYLPAMTDSEVQSAFGMDDGQIGFTIFRLTIEPDSNGWSKYIPSAKKAHEMGAKIIASPWHAPYDMRETIGSDYRVRYDMYDEYVDHLNHFVQYMSDNGAPVYGISIQNEPDIGDWTQWTIDEMLTFMRDYAHAIEGTKVMSPESYHFNRDYSDPILNDSAAAANTDIVIGHIYGGGLFNYPLAEEKGKEVWMTEYLMGENNSGNNLYWTIELAKNINSVMRANMNAYVWWTIVRYYGPIGDGQTASNPEDPRERYPAKGEVTKKGFALSQFSKFIRPGFIRVESEEYPSTSNIFTSAYKNPESSNTVVVMINDNDTEVEQYIRLKGLGTTTFATYTTSETKNCERGDDVIVADGLSLITLEPYSIVTFVSE
jgi:glucuronoarabinoxylan endo-1,4-beta-xylanase